MQDFSSAEITSITKALLKAHGQIRPAVRDEVNGFLRNKYATLSAVLDAVRKPLLDCGILLIQRVVESEPGTVAVETRLIHESGEWIASITSIPLPGEETRLSISQVVGATISYARRYGLMSMLAMTTVDEDTDGEVRPCQNEVHQKPVSRANSASAEQTAKSLPQIPNVSFEHAQDMHGKPIIIARGATLPNKEALKRSGFQWSPEHKTWWSALAM